MICSAVTHVDVVIPCAHDAAGIKQSVLVSVYTHTYIYACVRKNLIAAVDSPLETFSLDYSLNFVG